MKRRSCCLARTGLLGGRALSTLHCLHSPHSNKHEFTPFELFRSSQRNMSTTSHLRPTVTVFSSILDVAESLSSACADIPLHVIVDEALGGYGGTVEIDPNRLSAETMASLREAQILISEPAAIASLLKHDASALENLKWCQSTYAGVDPLFRAGLELPLSFQLTRFAGCFGPPIAEWTLARIIEHERGFAATASDQKEKKWAGSRERVLSYRYLSRMTLSILGCGDIGTCIATAAKAFGMHTVGYTRTPRDKGEKERVGAVDEYTTDVTYALQAGDFVVSVLPSTPETIGLLSGEALAIASKCKGGKCPVFLNVGRGDVMNEASIIQALDNDYISAAILDVFEVEPLPVESPLWSHSKVTISPHVSGLTQASDVPKVFLSNYERYIEGESLHYAVDWNKGY